ncbi:hypothetical protein GCM10027586_15750 [Kineococcus gypseus]|uniref:cupin n=1 Tax=Kineococcus gypseus TaxID=1637102 RepID=UPI003D7C9B38
MVDLRGLAEVHLETARGSAHGRSAELLVHDNRLRQTVIALTAGTHLGEHNPPHAGSVHVLSGRVRLTGGTGGTGGTGVEVGGGELVVITHERQALEALEDSVVLYTAVTGLTPEDRAV